MIHLPSSNLKSSVAAVHGALRVPIIIGDVIQHVTGRAEDGDRAEGLLEHALESVRPSLVLPVKT